MGGTVGPEAIGGGSERHPAWSPRLVAGVAFLALQIVLVIAGRFVGFDDFTWSPHTVQIHYVLDVEVGGRDLTSEEIASRYGVSGSEGWEAHSLRNLRTVIVQYERTYGRADGARVHLRYRVNGRPAEVWEWEPA